VAQHWGRRGAHLSENEGVRSECKKSGENSRQMAPVSTICDEHCRAMYKHSSFSKNLKVQFNCDNVKVDLGSCLQVPLAADRCESICLQSHQ